MQDFASYRIENWVDMDGLFVAATQRAPETLKTRVTNAFAAIAGCASLALGAAISFPAAAEAPVQLTQIRAAHADTDEQHTVLPAGTFAEFMRRLKSAPEIEERFQGADPDAFF